MSGMSTTLPITWPRHRFIGATQPSSKLVIGLHGRGDSLAGLGWLPQAVGLDEVNYLLLNAPDPWEDGYSWYDLAPDQEPGIRRSRARLVALLDQLGQQGWESHDVVLFGFSQGCLMAMDVGQRYAKPLAGICGISGYLFFPNRIAAEALPHARTMPWLITHGTRDQLLPIETTREHVRLLQAVGIPVEWHEIDKGHVFHPRQETPLIRGLFRRALRLPGDA
jgi:phospholipase/carboxylesterase